MTRVALFTLYTLLIGPVVDYQPSKDTPPRTERIQPLKKDLPPNPHLKKINKSSF